MSKPILHFIHGLWFNGTAFAPDDFYVESGILTHAAPPSLANVVRVDLQNHFVVPPYGDAHEHNFDNLADAPSLNEKYLRDGIFYAQGMTEVTSGARQVVAAGLVNTDTTVDVTYANGCLTAPEGHPKEIYESLAHGFYYPATSEQRAQVLASHVCAGDAYWEIDSAADLDKKWPSILAAKPDLIKIILSGSEDFTPDSHTHPELGKGLDPALVPLITSRAHAAGLKVAAHVDTAADYHAALTGGVDEMGHLPGYGIRAEDSLTKYRISDADIALSAQRHIKVQATAGIYVDDQTVTADLVQRQASQKDNLRRLKAAGVSILVGSDHYGEDASHEADYLHSLRLWTNLEMLTMWSVTTPQDIFSKRKVGELKPGYEASFLVLSANPVENWQATHGIVDRWKQGQHLDLDAGVSLPKPARGDKNAAHSEVTAQDVLRKVEAATNQVLSMTADVQQIDQFDNSATGSMRLLKPNYAAIVYGNPQKGAAPAYILADGKTLWRYPDASKSSYRVEAADPQGKGAVDWLGGIPIQSFFGLEAALKSGGIERKSLTYAGMRDWEGQPYQVLRHDFEEEGKRYTAWLYVGADDLIHRQIGTYYIPKPNGEPRTFEVDLRNIKQNVPMKAEEFAYVPPAEAKQIIPKLLLTKGVTAPDFPMESQIGVPLRLSDFRGKVVVLDFWATWCLPCLREMSQTNLVAAKFKEKGVVVLAVNVWDSKPSFQSWLPAHTQYDSLVFTLDPAPQGKDAASVLYNVTGIPTQYVIGRDGKIVAGVFGYDGPSSALEKSVESALAAE